MTETEQKALMEERLAYDDVLRENGHFIGEKHSRMLERRRRCVKACKVITTDGRYAETKEQIGGLLLLEAANLDQAIELMSRHRGVRFGPFEIRPADEEFNAIIAEKRLLGGIKLGAETHPCELFFPGGSLEDRDNLK